MQPFFPFFFIWTQMGQSFFLVTFAIKWPSYLQKNHSQTTLKFHTWNSDIVLKMSRKCENCLSSTLMECGIWMKETDISPEVRFVTAGTASGSINFCQTFKFLHFHYKFVCVLSLKLLKFGEIKGVKFLSRKSGGVNFLTNLMFVLGLCITYPCQLSPWWFWPL